MFKEKFIRLCNEKKESPSSVCYKVGITPATYSKWTDESIPRKATLMRIADYFDVTVEDLLSEEEKKPVHIDELEQGKISPEKRILLSAFDRASDDDRRVLWTLLDKYLTPNEKQYFSQSNQNENIG